jgi:hypothetical protein
MKGYEETWAELESKALSALERPELFGGLPLPIGYELSLRFWTFESFADATSWNFYKPQMTSEYHPILLLKTVWRRQEDAQRISSPDIAIKHVDKFKPIPTLSFSDRQVDLEVLERCLDEAQEILRCVRSTDCRPSTIDGTYFGIEVLVDSKSERAEWNSGLPVGDALLELVTALA